MQLKSSFNDSIATRARRQIMGMSLVTLGEGIPFFQGGDDLLRSKDMDNNSYDSETGSTRSIGAAKLRIGESACPSPARTRAIRPS